MIYFLGSRKAGQEVRSPNENGSADGPESQPPLTVRLRLPASARAKQVTSESQDRSSSVQSTHGGKGKKRVTELQETDSNIHSEAAEDDLDDTTRPGPVKRAKKTRREENTGVVKRNPTRQKRANGF